MKKVLIIAIDMRCGGVEKSMLEFLDILNKLNYKAHILFIRENGFLFNELPNVEYTILQHKFRFETKLNPLYVLARIKCKILLRFPSLIFKFVLKKNFDTIISFMEHEPLKIQKAHVSAKKIARLCFNIDFFHKDHQQVEILKNNIDMIWAISQEQANQIQAYDQMLGKKTTLLGNFRNISKIVESSKQIKIKYPKPTIVTISRLSHHKRLDIAIKAFAIVRQQNYDWNLKIIGDGPELESLRALSYSLNLSDNVIIDGEFMLNPFPYLKAASIFLLSSEGEGFGGVLVEALALNCPIISTNCPVGPSEILDNGNNGLLVPVNDEKQMAEAIINMMTNHTLRESFIAKSTARAMQYDINYALQRFKDNL